MRRFWKSWKENRRLRKACDSCGRGSVLKGQIEKRHPEAVIEIGEDGLIQGHLVAERKESRIRIGDRVAIGGGTTLDCALEITLSDDVILSYGCILADSDNHSLYFSERTEDVLNWKKGFHDWSRSAMAPIRICRGAWIGARVCILKGVTVGEGAVIGMGSVVTRDVPPYTVVAGNTARPIKGLDEAKARPPGLEP